jgi:hypothetical protein
MFIPAGSLPTSMSCMYVYVCIYTCMYVCMYAYSPCMYVYVCTYVCIYIYIYIYHHALHPNILGHNYRGHLNIEVRTMPSHLLTNKRLLAPQENPTPWWVSSQAHAIHAATSQRFTRTPIRHSISLAKSTSMGSSSALESTSSSRTNSLDSTGTTSLDSHMNSASATPSAHHDSSATASQTYRRGSPHGGFPSLNTSKRTQQESESDAKRTGPDREVKVRVKCWDRTNTRKIDLVEGTGVVVRTAAVGPVPAQQRKGQRSNRWIPLSRMCVFMYACMWSSKKQQVNAPLAHVCIYVCMYVIFEEATGECPSRVCVYLCMHVCDLRRSNRWIPILRMCMRDCQGSDRWPLFFSQCRVCVYVRMYACTVKEAAFKNFAEAWLILCFICMGCVVSCLVAHIHTCKACIILLLAE